MATAKKTAAPEEPGKEVATQTEAGVPAQQSDYDWGGYEGQGFEGQTAADVAIPLLYVLQSNSPQCKSVKNGGMGAKAGQLFNNVTQEIFDAEEANQGICVVPVKTVKMFVEWVPRKDGGAEGGGYVGDHEPESDVVVAAREAAAREGRKPWELKTVNGNDLIETEYMYCLTLDEADWSPTGFLCIPCTGMKIGAWRNFNTAVKSLLVSAGGRKVNPPLWANRVRVTTRFQSNAKGEFFNIVFSPALGTNYREALLPGQNHPTFQAALGLRNLVEEGRGRAVAPEREVGADTEGAGVRRASNDTEEPPF